MMMIPSTRPNSRILLAIIALAVFALGISSYIYFTSSSKGDSALPRVLALDATGKHAPTYVGATATSYTGNLGGITGANAKCAAAFAGSHICTSRELLRSGASSLSPVSGYGWVACDLYYVENSVPYTACDSISGSSWSTGSTDYTCSQWTSGFSSVYGTAVYTPSENISAYLCSNSLPIECCKG